MTKKIILIIIIVAVLGFVVYRVFIKEEKPEFVLEKVIRGQVAREVSETGVVKISEETNLSFKNTGIIERIYVEVGDEVIAGQDLAKLNAKELSIQLAEAQAALEVVRAKRGDAQVSLENARQNLEDIISTAEEDLNNAYEDALVALDNSYLKIYDAYNVIYRIRESYFTIPDSTGLEVIEHRDRIKHALEETKNCINEIEDVSQQENIDLVLSEVKESLEKIRDSLEAIQDIVKSAGFRNIVSSADTTSLDAQRTNINTAYANIVSSQQTISTIRVDNETSINTVQAQVSELENQLQEGSEGLYQAQIRQAQAQISLLENQIQQSILKSPTQGQITGVDKRKGEAVKSTETVVSFLPSAPFQVKVDIYEEDIVDVKVGNPVSINLVPFPEETLKGEVVLIDPAEKLIGGVVYYQVTIDFEETREGIKPGMTADIIIETNKRENVLIVPKRAVEKINGKRRVRVFKNGQVQEREIEIGLEGDGFLEVISGLEEGEEVVVGKNL